MTGYITGTLADADGAEELLRTAEQSLKVAEQLNCPRLNVHGTGLDDKGLPVIPTDVVSPAMWLTAARTLTRLAELGERAGRVFTLENLNTAVDHPAHPVRQGRGHPGAGRSGRQPSSANESRPVPRPDRRGEPDPARGTVHCRWSGRSRSPTSRVAANPAPVRSTTRPSPPRSNRLGYDGVVGLEAFASGDSLEALDRFRPRVHGARPG